MTTFADDVTAGVGMNMYAEAKKQELSAAKVGVAVSVTTKVHKSDGAKNYATTLASALCETPSLADSTREELANVITKLMDLPKPFGPTRLSRVLSAKAKTLVTRIMREYGYNTNTLNTALDIRDIIKSGKRADSTGEHVIKTRFEVDGVWLGSKWYPYARFKTYETGCPWYYLGITYAGDFIQLKTILALRDIGISQFIDLDAEAQKRATLVQQATRSKLDS
jgi:hypothetical protein